ncbi:MAG: murein L,D-transpeptidase catalytic domain family protein [Bacillota bacterium]
MKAKFFAIFFITIAFLTAKSQAAPTSAIYNKILSQGVPTNALNRMIKFLDESKGRSFQQDTYTCAKFGPDSVKPCEESERTNSSRSVTVESPETVAIVDFSEPSTSRRFFLINLKTGEVITYLVSHGKGSGNSNYATKFSNIKDSRQTSLGFYLAGETYPGKYGKTLRLYGLQKSNDNAYHRDIVLHGAWYAQEDFINSKNPQTGEKFGRLGVSWGCPALAPEIAAKVIPQLKNGGVLLHYYGPLMEEAMSGKEVTAPMTAENQNTTVAASPDKNDNEEGVQK